MRFFSTAGPVDCEGRTEREYGLGRMRTDLLVIWPYPGGVQKVVLELKVLHKTLEQTVATGLEQTWSYLDRCGTEKGHLVIFDRTPGKPWEEKLFQREASIHDHTIRCGECKDRYKSGVGRISTA